jgi:hypothetical protein
MASSRARPPIAATAERAGTPADIAFVLQELTACWDQSYEALARADLDRVAALMARADEHVARLADARITGDELRRLHRQALAARGRLEHGMKAGLDGVRQELRRTRDGTRALSGYRDNTRDLGGRIAREL